MVSTFEQSRFGDLSDHTLTVAMVVAGALAALAAFGGAAVGGIWSLFAAAAFALAAMFLTFVLMARETQVIFGGARNAER